MGYYLGALLCGSSQGSGELHAAKVLGHVGTLIHATGKMFVADSVKKTWTMFL